MTNKQQAILIDIYKKSNQGVISVSIGDSGNFTTDTPDKIDYINDLNTL
ncbi:hypothetical protein [Helicobacter sp. MIT 14-3879]|nr:hypothetical protein [Helicobacter sp. MIT 14-3879]